MRELHALEFNFIHSIGKDEGPRRPTNPVIAAHDEQNRVRTAESASVSSRAHLEPVLRTWMWRFASMPVPLAEIVLAITPSLVEESIKFFNASSERGSAPARVGGWSDDPRHQGYIMLGVVVANKNAARLNLVRLTAVDTNGLPMLWAKAQAKLPIAALEHRIRHHAVSSRTMPPKRPSL